MTTGADWLDQARRLADAVRAPAEPAPGATADEHGSDCRWCPVCQLAAVVRGERPEVTAALADVLTATAAALRALAEPPAEPAAGDAPEAPTEATAPTAAEDPPAGEQPTAQRFDIA
ncbi:hypothetical protein [Blastococcus sp. SYSU DS0619]